jgi:two-component system nitrogen regulation response regulator GlnG
LRERDGDLQLLVKCFLRRFNTELGKTIRQVAPETMAILERYSWPGNVRELQNVLRQALLRATGPVLLAEFLPAFLGTERETQKASSSLEIAGLEEFLGDRMRAGSQNLYSEAVVLLERDLLTHVLNHTGGNQAQTARLLGISRLSLRSKIRSHGLVIERVTK